MAPDIKAKIFFEHLLTNDTYNFLCDKPNVRTQEPLGIYSDLINCLNDIDFEEIKKNNIFLNIIFSPASNSIIKVNIPVCAKIITFDYNFLSRIPKNERIAILLHEYGHAFNPKLMGYEGEFKADDFAITHEYGNALRNSLQRSIKEFPYEFDKPVTYQRIERIPE